MNFPLLNAILNATSALLLVAGLVLIRQGRQSAHKKAMMAAFFCSVLFLASYLWYHFSVELRVPYAGPEWGKAPYMAMLLAHTILAATVPFLVIKVIRHALKDQRTRHRKWARITAPIWLFVSITGVLIYLTLYVWTDSYASTL